MMKIKIILIMMTLRHLINSKIISKDPKYLHIKVNIQIAFLGINRAMGWHRSMAIKYRHINQDIPI